MKDPAPPKEARACGKKESRRVKAQNKVQDESEEELPQLVPIERTPAKENGEVFLLVLVADGFSAPVCQAGPAEPCV